MSFQGSMVAIVTPFTKETIDEKALRSLVDWHLREGTHALVPCGTTGEAATLLDEEHQEVIALVVDQVRKKIPVIAGCGSNSTAKAIKFTKQAEKAGADATLHVTPYYNKPTQEGLFQHFEAIAESSPLPMILYNVPGRTGMNMTAETALRLSTLPNIVGIKEASGNLEQVATLLDGAPKDFVVLSGEDALNLQIYQLGGKGCISVTANIVPKKVAHVWNLHNTLQKEEAAKEQEALQPLNKALFMVTNPIPVKTAVAMMGYCQEIFRLPLCSMNNQQKKELETVLKTYQLF